jgi:hypothetical protein
MRRRFRRTKTLEIHEINKAEFRVGFLHAKNRTGRVPPNVQAEWMFYEHSSIFYTLMNLICVFVTRHAPRYVTSCPLSIKFKSGKCSQMLMTLSFEDEDKRKLTSLLKYLPIDLYGKLTKMRWRLPNSDSAMIWVRFRLLMFI